MTAILESESEHWLNDTRGVREAPSQPMLPFGGRCDFGTPPAGGDHGDLEMNLERLALRYVHGRYLAAQINERTAAQLRHRLLDFADTVPKNPKRVYRHHVERWMERPDLRPQYRRARLSALRGFTRWCVAEGHMVKDPCVLVPMPKVPPQLPKRLTGAEAQALVAAVSHDPRTKLVVLLMLQEGLRRMEVSRLNIDDVDFAERSIIIRGKGGCGNETDALPITQETWAALSAYLAVEGHSHGPLIRNRVRAHGRCAPSTISDLVREGMVAAGVKRPGDRLRTPHSCRHTAAHDLLERTQNVRAVQQALRHRSVRSTEVYLRGHTAELRGVMEGRNYTQAS